jgi:DNA-directed RNA polymerase specialized sigma24 family protein
MTDDRHLSQIVTSWSIVRGASNPEAPERQAAQVQLLEIYSDSIRRYLVGSLKDQTAADEVYQNFAYKLVRGDFVTADPEKGRFRSFVKTVLYRLMIDHHRDKKRNRANEIVADPVDDRVDSVEGVADHEFQQHWREGLLSYSWQQLEQDQSQRGGIYFSLLRARADRPDESHDDLINAVEKQTGIRPKPGSLRVTLHRARQKFADYLVEAVAASLNNRAESHLEDELIALDLKKYCEDAMARRGEN